MIRSMLMVTLVLCAAGAEAQTPAGGLPPIPPGRETALAESAAPPHVAREAAIYHLGAGGYERVRPGTNGFACLVERDHPHTIAPVCYDREAAETILPGTLEAARLRAAGADSGTIARHLAEGYRSGRLRAPRRTAIGYMLSAETRFHDPSTGTAGVGTPHLMFYAPYLTNRDIGSPGESAATGNQPFVVDEGTPGAFIVVLLPGSAAGGGERTR